MADRLERERPLVRLVTPATLDGGDVLVTGTTIFVELHLVVDRAMSVGAAHDICDAIEDGVEAKLPSARVTVHVEPDSHLK